MDIKDVSELLKALMDAVIDVTHADKGFLLLMREEGPEIAVARNLRQQDIPPQRAPPVRQHRVQGASRSGGR